MCMFSQHPVYSLHSSGVVLMSRILRVYPKSSASCELCGPQSNQFLLRNPGPHSQELTLNTDPPLIFTPSRVRTEQKRIRVSKRMVPATTQQFKQNKWRKLENALVFINKSKMASKSKKRYQPWRRTSKE